MSDRSASAGAGQVGMLSRLRNAMIGPGGRVRLVVLIALLILGVAIGGHIYGRQLASSDLADRDTTIQLLRSEGEKLETRFSDQTAQLAAVQAKLTSARAALDALMPSENTYHINPNQSLVVGDGHLAIGLVGSPTNESVNLNINGKQQSAVAGDIIHLTPDPLTNCHIAIQSFDMFKVIINATCQMAEPE